MTSASDSRIVIVGAGHAAGQVVASLKQKKFAGEIVLIGDEPYLPYQRPPLSKKFLAGELSVERLYVKPESFYDDPKLSVKLNASVESIDPNSARVWIEDGEAIAYDTLILATGSHVRKISVDGGELNGIHYLRNIGDVNKIRAEFESARQLVIVGAGYIGLEVAAVSSQLGLNVTVVEVADRVMSRVVSPRVSSFYKQEHIAKGLTFKLSTGLSCFRGERQIQAVETTDGDSLSADLAIVGVGVEPNMELADAAGLETDNGIVVDDRCLTSDPNIYAVGDCTSHPNSIYRRRIRLESVHNAVEQAKVAVANICGDDARYAQVPWFWSDQYDIKLQIAGLSEGYDDVVIRGNPADRSFSCNYLKEGRLIATDAINAPRDFVQSKTLIAAGASPNKRKLADTGILLKDLV